jgi:solute carrier family 25 (adenine nucleotide translocator) protein 4/5/6/31
MEVTAAAHHSNIVSSPDAMTTSTSSTTSTTHIEQQQQQQQQQQQRTIQSSKTTTNGRLWLEASAKDALCGAAAGAFAKTAVAPIERVKLLLQLKRSLVTGEKEAYVMGNNAKQVAWKVYADQGLLAFWRGNTPNVLRQGGAAGLNFLFMDWYKAAIAPIMTWSLTLPSHRSPSRRRKRRAFWSSFASGGLAGGTVTTVLYPAEFLRTRLAMDVGHCPQTRLYPQGMRDVFLSTLRSDGLKGLYQGYGIALAGVVVYRALHLGGYDALKTEILYRRGNHDMLPTTTKCRNKQNNINNNHPELVAMSSSPSSSLTLGERFMAAQIVSIVAGTLCYPIDSVRRRLMMQAGQPISERLYRNSLHAFYRIQMEEGLRGFYLGIGPNLIRSVGGALLLVSYDLFKGMFS